MTYQIYSLVPSDTAHYLYLLFFILSLAALILFLLLAKHRKIRIVVALWGLIMGGAGVMIFYDAQAEFYLTEQALVIDQKANKKEFARESFDNKNARVVNLLNEHEMNIWYKTEGTGMHGFNIGWFVLNNDQRAYVFLTRQEEPAVYIPTTKGFVLLLSIQNAEAFIKELKEETIH